LAVLHREQKVYAVTSPVISLVRSDVCVHGTCVGPRVPVELRTYPHLPAPDSEVHDREATGVALAREGGEVHAVEEAGVAVDCWMIAKVVEPQTVEADLPRSIQLVAPVAATYAATWSAGDDAAVVHAEVERAVTAVVVLMAQRQG
jgi:hypothetical protein